MKSNFLKKTKKILIVLSILAFSIPTLAQETDSLKIQGIIMNIDLKKNTMVVNERTFIWSQNTTAYNAKGSPITMDKFNAKTWVYIEANKNENNKITINKIYLLPKYVDKKEKHLYPFME